MINMKTIICPLNDELTSDSEVDNETEHNVSETGVNNDNDTAD